MLNFFDRVDMWPMAASEHLLYEHPVAFRRRHCKPAAIQFFGDDSAELNALHLAGCGRSARGVVSDQRSQRFFLRARPLLQKPVEVEKAVLVAVARPPCPHPSHWLAPG